MTTSYETIGNIAAIKRYFEAHGRRTVTLDELRRLSPTQRESLGAACAAALDAQRVVKPPR
jgi:hypothetical protein